MTSTITSTITLGAELRVGRLGFGAMRLTGPQIWGPPADRETAIKVVRRAVELGVTFIDTADAYGPGTNEELLAEALHPYPEGLVIATKAGQSRPSPGEWVPLGRPEYLRQQAELSLRRLRLDRIEVFQLHRVDPTVPLDDQLGALRQLRDEGKIRYVGLSEVTVEQITQAREIVDIVSVENQYSLADRQHEPVLDYCERNGLAFIPWQPVLTGQRATAVEAVATEVGATPTQVAIAWLLHRSPAMLPIPGTSSPAHLEENVAAQHIELTPAQMERLG